MAKTKTPAGNSKKRTQVSQSEFPNQNLEASLRIAQALWDNFAGKSAEPHQIAMALDMSPTSGSWRNLCGSSIAYGLTSGGYAAPEISLTDLGRRIVAPLEDGDDAAAMAQAVLAPRIMQEFFQKYDKAKFPRADIAKNVLVGFGLPKDRADKSLGILEENGRFVGVIQETKTGPFVALSSPAMRSFEVSQPLETEDVEVSDIVPPPGADVPGQGPVTPNVEDATNNRVFITHGKNKKILNQVKELVVYGKFEPIVAQETETSAKPVPKKVMDDMRKCKAAVIHVGVEGFLTDADGNEVPQINANVLIEIGAAMALYGEKYILLVEEGVKLPSNLQGLYECRYEGDELNMTATMKLLKAFNEF